MGTYLKKYFNGVNLASASTVYDDADLITPSANGYYSDGVTTRYQNSGVLLGFEVCPDCNTYPCNQGIGLPGNNSGIFEINTFFGSAIGAIKVVIDGVGATPMGLDFRKEASPVTTYNIFSSTGGVTGVQQAPNNSIVSYFYSTTGSCTAMGSSTAELPTWVYNNNSGIWETNNSVTSVDTSNRRAVYTSNPGRLITYIPKTSAIDFVLTSHLYLPCPPPASKIGVSISCPAALPSISTTGFDSSDSDNACNDSTSTTVYHGAVSGTSGTLIKVNDWIFQDTNSNAKAPDGYYKALKAVLDGVTEPNGTFQVSNGVVISITDCN
jgi:hypothetical protein